MQELPRGYELNRAGQQANPLFFLVYGSEVILPVDLTWILPRIKLYNKDEVDST